MRRNDTFLTTMGDEGSAANTSSPFRNMNYESEYMCSKILGKDFQYLCGGHFALCTYNLAHLVWEKILSLCDSYLVNYP